MKSSTNIVWAFVVAAAVSLFSVASASAQTELSFEVFLGGPDTATVTTKVYENPSASPLGPTILAVHGFTETSTAWEPLKDALFTREGTKGWIKRVIVLDLFGRDGTTNLPVAGELGDSLFVPGQPRLYGEVTIQDNAAIVVQVIQQLVAQGIGPRIVMGHSMGGLAVQAAQQLLMDNGSRLSQLGVFQAILLAPVPAEEISDYAVLPGFEPDPAALEPFVVDSPLYGQYLDLTPVPQAVLFGGGFTDRMGNLTPAAGLVDLSTLVGYEPLFTVGQVSDPTIPRPSANAGIFKPRNGTLLTVVGFSEDVLTPIEYQPALYEHLIGRKGFLYREVTAPDAVHNMYQTNPNGMLDQLGSMF